MQRRAKKLLWPYVRKVFAQFSFRNLLTCHLKSGCFAYVCKVFTLDAFRKYLSVCAGDVLGEEGPPQAIFPCVNLASTLRQPCVNLASLQVCFFARFGTRPNAPTTAECLFKQTQDKKHTYEHRPPVTFAADHLQGMCQPCVKPCVKPCVNLASPLRRSNQNHYTMKNAKILSLTQYLFPY